jgi:hypothetical protein
MRPGPRGTSDVGHETQTHGLRRPEGVERRSPDRIGERGPGRDRSPRTLMLLFLSTSGTVRAPHPSPPKSLIPSMPKEVGHATQFQ